MRVFPVLFIETEKRPKTCKSTLFIKQYITSLSLVRVKVKGFYQPKIFR